MHSSAPHSIADMARAGCTSERGIRLWEERGMLGAVERTEGEHRRYTDGQMDRAKIIAAGQFGGFDLDTIGAMLNEWGEEARSALIIRLSDQMRAAARLAENLPRLPTDEPTGQDLEYDL